MPYWRVPSRPPRSAALPNSAVMSSSKHTPGEAPAASRLTRGKIFLFLFGFLVLILGLCEAGARLYLRLTAGYDGKHLYQFVFDPYKNILPAPNFVDTRGIRHNAQGFRRDSLVQRRKPPDTIRIFLMGGSTAYGVGGLWPHIQDTFPVLKNSQTIDSYLEQDLAGAFPKQPS